MLRVDRLLDEQDARDQALESRRGLHTPPQIEQAIEIIKLLVAIQRDMVGPSDTIQHCRDLDEALQLGVDRAADLELEKSVAEDVNGLFQRFGQAVVDFARMAGDGV